MKPRKRIGNAENYLVPREGAAWPDWLSELRQLRDRRPIVTPVTVAVAETLYRVAFSSPFTSTQFLAAGGNGQAPQS
jgi:hypothetical protein